MENKLNEMQQLRLLLIKESGFDVTKAKSVYDFVIGTDEFPSAKSSEFPDGIYFIKSENEAVHQSIATPEDKSKTIAVGYKLGNKFANVVLKDAAGGEEIALCTESCGSNQFFKNTFAQAITDWNGIGNTNDMRSKLNPEIGLKDNEYIPSVAQLHLLMSNIVEVNKALEEVGGDPIKEDWYWSSTEDSSYDAWYVYFNSGYTNYYSKNNSIVVRPAVAFEFIL